VPADWNPSQYRQFAAERSQPFFDLLDLIRPSGIRRAVDLGCGPGEMTAVAVERLDIEETVGIDSSPAMLAATHEWAGPRLRFEAGDIGAWTAPGDHDLVLAAASLQWVPDHAAVLRRWTAALAPGGQLAVQVPANAWMPSHRVMDDVANSPAWRDEFGPEGPPADPVAVNVLQPEQYAQLLFDLGFTEQTVRLQVYPHVLPSTRHVVEWVRGTSLTRFEKRLAPDAFARFLADYEAALVDALGDNEPQFFPFRRILFWVRRPTEA
jgi:trans-aconitate 2-methyltransferase